MLDLHAVGGGCPDVLVGHRSASYLIEIKTEKGLVRESQETFAREWRGAPVLIVRSVADALRVIGVRLDT